MKLERSWLQVLIFGGREGDDGEAIGVIGSRRYLQDSPILPDVWMRFGELGRLDRAEDLLLTPYLDTGAGRVATVLSELLGKTRTAESGLAYNQTVVAVRLTFEELFVHLLPRTGWWRRVVDRTLDRMDPDASNFAPLADRLGRLAQRLGADALLPSEGPLRAIREDLDTTRAAERADKAAETAEGKAMAAARKVDPHPLSVELLWMVRTAGVVARALEERVADEDKEARRKAWERILETPAETVEYVARWLEGTPRGHGAARYPLVHSINLNRTAFLSVALSHQTVKADAAVRLFNIRCGDLTWAVVDTGIDAEHPAFRARDPETGAFYKKPFEKETRGGRSFWTNRTRVRATFDFTRIRDLLSVSETSYDRLPAEFKERWKGIAEARRFAKSLTAALLSGRDVDWSAIRTLIEIPHEEGKYKVPPAELAHGTHVAGILAGDWDDGMNPFVGQESAPAPGRHDGKSGNDGAAGTSSTVRGICPDLNLYDLRVLKGDETDDEFSVISALQFLRYLNSQRDYMVVHGANVSLSLRHKVDNYACGRTPVCDECERLVASGVVVVAAAGNQGYRSHGAVPGSLLDVYQDISITDPGNAEGVITVGSTHRTDPHTYGVSFFSSRGPTGDGRAKPDLVAPGEKIEAPVPDQGLQRMDGTSMAAPHVSGAAALLIARHRELMGQPARIKSILCRTATDLGRDRSFQGAGLLDILRALQSI